MQRPARLEARQKEALWPQALVALVLIRSRRLVSHAGPLRRAAAAVPRPTTPAISAEAALPRSEGEAGAGWRCRRPTESTASQDGLAPHGARQPDRRRRSQARSPTRYRCALAGWPVALRSRFFGPHRRDGLARTPSTTSPSTRAGRRRLE